MSFPFSAKNQQGIATILTVVLLGLSLASATLVGVSHLRSSQELSTSLHAQTMAQKRAWLAADAFGEYLEQVIQTHGDWQAFDEAARTQPGSLSMAGLDDIALRLAGYEETSPSARSLTLHITATAAQGSRAAATTTLETVYQITPPGLTEGEGPQPDRRVIQFRDGLNISGDLRVLTLPGERYQITVDGDVNLGGLSAGGIDAIRSTRSIRFVGGSSTDFLEMHANCDVQVSNGSFTVENVKATRNACLANTINSQSIIANGSVEVTGGVHGDIRALANTPTGVAQCATGAAQLCSIPSSFGVRTYPSPRIANIYSKNHVEFNSSVSVGRVQAEGDLLINKCSPEWSTATYGGSFTNNSSCRRSATKTSQPVLLDPVPPVEVEPETFDANRLRDIANYIYSIRNGEVRVEIQGVDGIRDSAEELNPLDVRRNGYYFRSANIIDPANPGWTSRTVAGYACINNNAPSRRDETDSHCVARLGHSHNNTTPLPQFSRNNVWSFNGDSHAPGIVLVDGDMEIGSGTYTNTFIATGNLHVNTAGGAVFAPNYAGRDGVTVEGHTALGVCNNPVYAFRPTEFCEDGGYDHRAYGAIGNFALLAGSCPSGSQGGCASSLYSGGDIRVEKAVFGATKAGNLFSSSGNARLYGYVSSLAQRNNGTTINMMGASTTINLQVPVELQQRYDPAGGTVINEVGGTSGAPGEATPGAVELRWGRYL
ncbi:hypothetical protein HG264_09355 [Pseudomonas sp. gcc21]|uniref:hypothetical protein n=1 Tax=Pseudomonas sp. gcc21 TaxID=2726989 RepID=UPI001451F691|nr:hypothetical protein [Pseudomonas sp. gcc21]QJD59103.1 hypothetical protein HG264_09355 [Pseudomonas sp. gcc21]